MSNSQDARNSSDGLLHNIVGFQDRRLGRTVIRTYRTKINLEEVVPNEQQPRLGLKEDIELQRQIEANGGIFEPILVEPHPDLPEKFRIVDGDRRWTNAKVLVDAGKDHFRQIPIEVTDRTLSDEERLRVWIYIHRQRKEWDAREKEMVAYRFVDLVGRASAANILGVTVRELDKLVAVYELSERFTNLREPGAAITWARELTGISKKLLSSNVVDAVVEKVNAKRITNSKDLRKLRKILKDPVAKDHFLEERGDIESAMLRIAPPRPKPGHSLIGDIGALAELVKRYSWTDVEKLRGDSEVLGKIEEAEALLEGLRKSLSS